MMLLSMVLGHWSLVIGYWLSGSSTKRGTFFQRWRSLAKRDELDWLDNARSHQSAVMETLPLPVLPGKWDMPRVHTNHIPLQESLPLPVLPGKWDMPRVHTNHIPLQETRAKPRLSND
jgi:hypothetical protein